MGTFINSPLAKNSNEIRLYRSPIRMPLFMGLPPLSSCSYFCLFCLQRYNNSLKRPNIRTAILANSHLSCGFSSYSFPIQRNTPIFRMFFPSFVL